ncbi:hypothetical protein [Pseudomonas mercuritolerans]|uniref:Uncharacterized protein n=1 Tax=Pseudomonas mercuritolerans TaxID=2951809 RepID=A0ABT2XN53_9PSED|nr:hypothetical protein [Pseudomonas mercuritolerans]MCV2220131.1 hypothetical protein [Pseudomonas mercuritolerans]
MSSASPQSRLEPLEHKSMQEFGETFIQALPKHIRNLKIPGRTLEENQRRQPLLACVGNVAEIQDAMLEVLNHSITQDAQLAAESAFRAFLEKPVMDSSVLSFFNGWNETHKTTSLVSAKIIMRCRRMRYRYLPTDVRVTTMSWRICMKWRKMISVLDIRAMTECTTT